ncbi:MAG: carboxypeptidase regulatory-like domain-containing protein [Planctomycetota bacterium]|nr:carboxypeptidase regulatory-like domain-containing protein [Planctomycetota bacterium]
MKAKLLIVLIALSLGLGAYLILSGSGLPAVTDDTELAVEQPEPGTPDPGSNLAGPLPPEVEPEPSLASTRASVSSDERPGWVTADLARDLKGRIVLPPGTPKDEALSLRLVVLSDSDVFVAGYEQDIEGDTFTLTVPPRGRGFELHLEGRYLYLDRPARFDGDHTGELLLEPHLGAWVTGRMHAAPGSAGLDWSAGEVRVGPDFDAGMSAAVALGASDLAREVEPESDGDFQLESMPAERPFGLEFDIPGAPLFVLGGQRLSPGEHRVLRIDLEAGVRVAGVVQDQLGAPIAGAQISVVAGEDIDLRAQRMVRQSESAADGTFEVSGVPAGKLRVRASADGYLTATPEAIPLADGEHRSDLVLVLERGNSIAGHVLLPDGSPAAEASVQLIFDPAALNGLNAMNARVGAEGRAETDAEGAFRITGLGKGPFLVKAEWNGYSDAAAEAANELVEAVASAAVEQLGSEELVEDYGVARDSRTGPWHFAQVTGVRPGDEELELHLRNVPALTGQVLDVNGAPVTSFRIDLRAGSLGGLMAGNATQRTINDPEGRFSIDEIQDGSWNLYVRSDGFGAAGPIAADRPGVGDQPMKIVLERGVSVAGHVLDPGGHPVKDAVVTWQSDARDMVLNIIKASPTIEARSGDDGSFLLEELPTGSLTLTTTAADWAPALPRVLEVTAGEAVEDVEVRLREGGTIAGLFLDEEGEPLEDALVQIQLPTGSEQQFTQTDTAGEFRVERLVPGQWQVIGVRPGGEEADNADPMAMLKRLEMEMVDVVDGQEVFVTLGSLPEDPVHLIGQVEPASEIAGGIAILIPEGEDLLGAMKMAPIAADGSFELDLDAPGNYVITLQSTPEGGVGQDSVEYNELVPQVPVHRVTLTLPAGSVSGKVTGPGGKPLKGTRVSLYADGSASTGTMSGGKYAEATTGADGSYRIPHLEPGAYTVGAGGRPITAIFDEEASFGRLVRTGVVVTGGEEVRGVDFRLDAAGSIVGRIVDSSGAPVGGASIFVRDSKGRLLERVSLQTTGPDGRYNYGGVAPGDYTVAARTTTEATATEADVKVRSEEATTLNLTLEPATMLEVVVTDSEGTPMQAGIEILDSSGRDVAGQFGMADLTGMLSGEFSTTTRNFGPLPPGKYKVVATAGELSATKPLSLKGQEDRKLRIRLK